jgi:3-deoxy-D-manno-octulosonate 8-phosphate phosphatase (KDO 8-P phosphatase)
VASSREPTPPGAAARPLERILAEARLLVLDVDGTLTDGRVAYVGSEELAAFHVHDGQGLVWLREAGVQVAWVSGRGSRAVERRAKELGVRELHLGVIDKARVLDELQRRLDIAPEHTAVMGDDLTDLPLAARAALFAAPANARAEVRSRALLVTHAAGGAGAVRELAERMLAARGLWKARVARALGQTAQDPSAGAPEAAE